MEEVEDVVGAVEVHHEGERLEQHRRVEAGDVGPVALADVEDTDERQGAHRFAQARARQPEALGEVRFPRQPVAGMQLAVEDHLLDPGDGVVGAAGLGDRRGRGDGSDGRHSSDVCKCTCRGR